jgi:uncharacterized membrane protein
MTSRTIAVGAVAVLLLAACGSADTRRPTVAPTTVTPTTVAPTTVAPTSSAEPTSATATVVTSPPAPDTSPPEPETTYEAPIDLGGTWAHDINNAGVIVGTLGGVEGEGEQGTEGRNDARAIWWPNPSADPQLLDVAPGELSFGWAVNDQGEILVRTGHPAGPTAALVVNPQTGVVAELRPEDGYAEAWAFNDRGEVLVKIGRGWEEYYEESLVWDSRSDSVDTPPGLPDAGYVLSDINDNGDVVGHIHDVPFFWDRTDNVIHYLDIGDADQGYATGLNNRGQIVGFVRADMRAPERAAVWDTYSSAPRLFDLFRSFSDINNAGQLLAGSWVLDLEGNDVAQLPAVAGNAAAINDLGQVVGASDGHAALWNPR